MLYNKILFHKSNNLNSLTKQRIPTYEINKCSYHCLYLLITFVNYICKPRDFKIIYNLINFAQNIDDDTRNKNRRFQL